jgi:agmatinase
MDEKQEEVAEKIFGGSEFPNNHSEKTKVVVLQCPYDTTASYMKGTRNGPGAILDATEYLELFDDELRKETYRVGIYTPPALLLQELTPKNMVSKVKEEVLEVLKSGKMPAVLGGEHSVSIGSAWAASEMFKDLSVLHLDAHFDLRDEYEGEKFSHACVARRFLERCAVVQVGMRSLSKEENDFLAGKPDHLKSLSVYDIFNAVTWKDDAVKHLSENVYISIDLDVLDPSIMPSTGTPEPGGMGWYELLGLLKGVAKSKNIVGFDIVELMPSEGNHAPDFLAAKLLYRLIGYIFHKWK